MKHFFLAGFLGCALFASAGTVYTEAFQGEAPGWRSEKQQKLTFSTRPDGVTALCLTDDRVVSARIALASGKRYRLKLDTWSERASQLKIGVLEYDRSGNSLTPDDDWLRTLEQLWDAGKQKRNYLMPMDIPFDTSKEGHSVEIVVKKHGKERSWIGSLSIVEDPDRVTPGSEPDPAEVPGPDSLLLPGPDGLLYPNFTDAGLREWRVKEENLFPVRDFGGLPDGTDAAPAIRRAVEAAVAKGGGVILFEPGVYRLEQRILVTASGIVFRGAGRDKTRLTFAIPESGVVISPVSAGPSICRRTKVELYFPREGAKEVRLEAAGKAFREWKDAAQFQPTKRVPEYSRLELPGEALTKVLPSGEHALRLTVLYNDGSTRVSEQSFQVYAEASANYSTTTGNAVIAFQGIHYSGLNSRIPLISGVKRGDRKVRVSNPAPFKAGGFIHLSAPNTARWKKEIHSACPWSTDRAFVSRIISIKGDLITLDRPVRQELPAEDGPVASRFEPVQFCGVEDFTIEQLGEVQRELKIGTVHFLNAADCRALRVNVENTGGKPLHFTGAKNCLVADAVIKGAWNPWESLSYVGFDRAWDCRMERVETFRMRHAPIFNIHSSGNVVRDSVFHESDAQWHMAWCRDNLFEQCRIESVTGYSGYGYGFYSTPYDDAMHGSNGPRNVVYNCEASSEKSAVYMGGMNRQWMIMYNTFTVDKGPGVIERLGCGDNRIVGNVFHLKDPKAPLFYYEFLDSTGDTIRNNTVHGGSGRLALGPGIPGETSNNQFLPPSASEKSKPPVPSLYLWQVEKYRK